MYPPFICIGAQKAGTTWLHYQMRHHAEVWLPPVKELGYFNHSFTSPLLPHLLLGSPAQRLRLQRIIRQAWHSIKKRQHIGWFLRYLFLAQNDAWYSSLFSPKRGQIAGEIIPGYAILDAKIVEKIHALMPDLKIIYLLRDPIDRTWSQANRTVRQNLFKGKHDEPEHMRTFMETEDPHKRSNYFKNLQIWECFYTDKQIFVGFFEQLNDNPRQLLLDIYQFLGIATDSCYISDSISQSVNSSQYRSIPEYWISYLAEKYYESLKLLHQKYNNTSTAKWLSHAKKYLKN